MGILNHLGVIPNGELPLSGRTTNEPPDEHSNSWSDRSANALLSTVGWLVVSSKFLKGPDKKMDRRSTPHLR
jgi:hypothetical protein